MGRGKRGRTQRRHFKEGRENVWQYSSKRNRPDDAASAVSDPNNSTPTHWEPFETQNPGFELYYKAQGIVPEEEWDEFIRMLRKPLPAAFRINSSGQFAKDIQAQLENDFMRSLELESNNQSETEAIRPLPWYPHKLAWHSNFSRMQLRKNQTLERFHEFLKQENEVGNITRQEAVSMVPPLFLDVLPNHHVLDMCAAPGSKTFQLLEIIHQSIQPGSIPDGLVIANDVDVQRCNLLIHQTKRMCTANLIVTNHEAQHFPSISLISDRLETSKEEQEDTKKQILQFDRVLCDVPCSGDGTLRKAPDIWRKWNAGNGNGVHRLQVEIAMRGIMLLKVGGRMVYSTCSMNPVENEAVVAEILRRCGKSVELLNVSSELPELIRRPGLKTWKVRDKGAWITSYEDAPTYRRNVLVPSMFPCDRVLKETHTDGSVQEDAMTNGSEIEEKIDTKGIRHQDVPSVVQESNTERLENQMNLADLRKAPGELEETSEERASVEDSATDVKVEGSTFPLERCMRILPHDQNGGAFFVAVFRKLSHVIPENNTRGASNNCSEKVENELKSETEPSQDVPCQELETVVHATSDTNLIIDQSPGMATEVGVESYSEDVSSKDADTAEAETCDNREIVKMATKGVKEKLQSESKWRGVDPVVFFTDVTTINSIKSFYGISESFPFDGHLVARNTDLNHVKRIYYVSKSVHNILQLNFQVGQRLKITSLGLKIFERQTAKEPSSPCSFRLSSEALPLLLPYISKQILSATLADFHHLVKYRVVKFQDFVVADLGDKASKLMGGCCVVVLNEGEATSDTISVDASTIAIICWKGKTNVSIMVSQLDAQELLSRLSARFGTGASPVKSENDGDGLENDGDGLENDTVDGEEPESTEDAKADMEAL